MDADEFGLELHAARYHATRARIGDFAAMRLHRSGQSFAVVNRAGRQFAATSLEVARSMLRDEWDVVADAALVVFGPCAVEMSFDVLERSGFLRVLVPFRAGQLAELGEKLKPETIEVGRPLTPSPLDVREIGQLFSELLDHATQQLTRRGLDFDDVEIERAIGLGRAGYPADRVVYLDFVSDEARLREEFTRRAGGHAGSSESQTIEARELRVKIVLSAPDLLDDVATMSENKRDPVHDSIRQRISTHWRAESSPGGLMLSRRSAG